MQEVDLGEPTSPIDRVYLGCTQRECKTSEDIVNNYRDLFDTRMAAGAVEELLYSEKSDASLSSWSCDMEGHAKKCVERYLRTCKHIDSTITQSRNSMY